MICLNILKQLTGFQHCVKGRNFYIDIQYSFYASRRTITLLCLIITVILSAMESGQVQMKTTLDLTFYSIIIKAWHNVYKQY